MLKSACCSMGCAISALEEETYIVFTSDHGDGHGAHQWIKKPACTRKSSTFPFIISHKGITRAGSVDTLIWSPSASICCPRCAMSAARASPDGLEGLSLRSLAEGNAPDEWRRELVVETIMDIGSGPGGSAVSRAVLTDRYKIQRLSHGPLPRTARRFANRPGRKWSTSPSTRGSRTNSTIIAVACERGAKRQRTSF